MSTQTTSPDAGTTAKASGAGRLLVAVYAVFAAAATARGLFQILTKFSEAPLAYGLSALAAVVYLAATVALAKGAWALARLTIVVEAVGVIAVGALSYARPELFPDKTVWSHFGSGYGYLPLVLPFVGLWWLARRRAPRAG